MWRYNVGVIDEGQGTFQGWGTRVMSGTIRPIKTAYASSNGDGSHCVRAVTSDGLEYVHEGRSGGLSFANRDAADRLAKAVLARGMVDLSHWRPTGETRGKADADWLKDFFGED